ncbi:hypothetical protein A3D71_01415 [Candidatus Kaiserbacteria bacterium RIFCSPHIGHO2_02_FULL_55_20]|uniref:Uncharacterized protein n=1 Tax=Candidatus Kaiserbacteria bacterium RIFCSPHIGHO2_02_FULL_55_20 TaxID=1798497 RepID=A0A1F6DXT4_9BACT|nr:MAG: hypothetical protein A2680_03520 [Candidatus Kaiserbacteria bacterium RIFCSPHIGHO2_01_FULL_55_37]OGG66157.1 MAG: hypothetical protein A3D71_01415 [Candidatus Kaiserbacteria bacterium RIFCSPHIGHO2_02_FULL_55_20]
MNVASISSVFANWPTDWIILGVVAAVIAAECLRAGTNRAASLGLALPLALLLSSALPSAALLGGVLKQAQAPAGQAIIFLVLVIFSYFLANRILSFFSDSSGKPVQALIAGIATAVLLVVFWFQVPALDSLWHFGQQVTAVFGESYRFWWLAGSYIALAVVRS